MADISQEISAFQNAVYGEEVRGSMISLAEKLNDVTEDCEDTVAEYESGYASAVASATAAAEAANNAASDATGAASSATSAAASANAAASNATSKANAAQALSDGISAAETARASAETARRSAETSRANAEAARVTAETARAGSESNRQSAELTRQEAETARNSAELSRVSAEATRGASETQRQSNESSRQSAESNRSTIFTQMQNAFADMQQQTLPPATTSTLGGIIVGEGLSVAADGTLSFEAGDFLTEDEAEATYATITSVEGKADAVHYHAASDITSGTLGVARGGTGVTTAAAERERLGLGSTTDALPIANGGTGATTASGALAGILGGNPLGVTDGGTGSDTLTANAILAGNGTAAVGEVATASGALYATTSGGAASFGTLPIAQGGTGATTAEDALDELGALPLTGGTITGEVNHYGAPLSVDSETIDRDGAIPLTDKWGRPYYLRDKDGDPIGYFGVVQRATSGAISIGLYAYNDNNGTQVSNSLILNILRDGTRSYGIGDSAAFCSALHVGDTSTETSSNVNVSSSATVNLTSITLAAGSYIVIIGTQFANNATGRRVTALNTNATSVDGGRIFTVVTQAVEGGATFVSYCCFVHPAASTKYYANVWQNSGSALSCAASITAVRIK